MRCRARAPRSRRCRCAPLAAAPGGGSSRRRAAHSERTGHRGTSCPCTRRGCAASPRPRRPRARAPRLRCRRRRARCLPSAARSRPTARRRRRSPRRTAGCAGARQRCSARGSRSSPHDRARLRTRRRDPLPESRLLPGPLLVSGLRDGEVVADGCEQHVVDRRRLRRRERFGVRSAGRRAACATRRDLSSTVRRAAPRGGFARQRRRRSERDARVPRCRRGSRRRARGGEPLQARRP